MGEDSGVDAAARRRARLDAATVTAAPTQSLNRRLTAMFRLIVGGGLAISLVLAGWLGWMLGVSQPSIDRLQKATTLVASMDVSMQAQQSDLRAYLATADESYLTSYREANALAAQRSAQLSAVAGGIAPDRLVAFEVGRQQWISGWADRIAAGTLSANAGFGHAADVAQLSQAIAQGHQLFVRYADGENQLTSTLQSRLDAARSAQQTATIVAALLALLLAVGTAALGVRRQLRLRDSVAKPMTDIGYAMGSLVRGDYVLDEFEPAGPAELYMLCTLVQKLGVKLESRRSENDALHARERERIARTDVILGVAREVAGSLNLRYVLEAVATAASGICASTSARLWLVEQPGAPMLLAFDTAYGRVGIREQVELDLGSGAAGRAAKYGRPALGEGAEVIEGVPVIAVPLIVGARVVGALECSGGAPREIADEVLTSLETLATQAAAAIEASRLHQAAEEMSVTDALTGLANRRQLDRDLPTEVDRAARYDRPMSVLFLDLDHFKQLNDRYGHSYGDLVLQQVGEVLRTELRAVDRAYRMGGEEFVIVAPESTATDGVELAERLRTAITRATSTSGTLSGVTASLGVATLPTHGTSGPVLLAAADAALYAAKAAGRDRVHVAADVPTTAVPDQRLPYAMPTAFGRPSLHLQPLDEEPAV